MFVVKNFTFTTEYYDRNNVLAQLSKMHKLALVCQPFKSPSFALSVTIFPATSFK